MRYYNFEEEVAVAEEEEEEGKEEGTWATVAATAAGWAC